MLIEAGFNKLKLGTLVQGFTHGFDIGFRGNLNRHNFSDNLPFRIGTPVELWNKIMKEVALQCYAGPFLLEQMPFKTFIQ